MPAIYLNILGFERFGTFCSQILSGFYIDVIAEVTIGHLQQDVAQTSRLSQIRDRVDIAFFAALNPPDNKSLAG
jgi:hypothetical protein